MIGKILFILATLFIVAFAYLPAIGVNTDNLLNPNCELTHSCTRYVYLYSHLQHSYLDQWVIDEFTTEVRGAPNPRPFSPILYSGDVVAKIRLYNSDGSLRQEDTYQSPYNMGLNSDWGFGWTFMAVPDGTYRAAIQYYSTDGQELTTERSETVVVSQ